MIFENFTKINTQLNQLYNQQKLHHLILINGQKGIGKSSFSQEFTRNILGNGGDYNANLLLINQGYNKAITIDKIRQINNFINHSSINNCDKFIIIDSICQANISSQNALLKMLEEPNSKNYFILICHNINQLMPTIKSRSFIINSNKLNNEQFIYYLKHNNIINNEQDLSFLSQICNGSIGLAINEGKNLINFYQLLIKSFAQGYICDNLYKNITDKNFSTDNLLIIFEFFALRMLKKSSNILFKDFFGDELIINHIVNRLNHQKLKFIIDDSILMINNCKIYNLDQKTTLINIFNYLNYHD